MSDPLPDTATAGAMLRAARERQGLHIAALAAAIKVAPRKLDALENDRLHELPDATFARALAQTVCRTLKIDARPVLALLPASVTLTLEPVSNVLNEPFRERPGRDDPGFGAAAIRPMVWAGLVLMMAALLVYFLPAGLWSALVTAPAQVAPVPRPASAPMAPGATPVPPADAAATPPAASAALSLAGTEVALAQPPASGAAGPAAAATAAPTSGETVFSVPATNGAADTAVVSGPLVLRSTEASWVDVRDARGQVLLSRTVLPGESVGLDGSLPLRLTIGNAAATQVSFRGQVVDLVSRTRDNVARLELP